MLGDGLWCIPVVNMSPIPAAFLSSSDLSSLGRQIPSDSLHYDSAYFNTFTDSALVMGLWEMIAGDPLLIWKGCSVLE